MLHIVSLILVQLLIVGVIDTTSYVVVGAAAVLGAACRAPLTAMALMVEITRCVCACCMLVVCVYVCVAVHVCSRTRVCCVCSVMVRYSANSCALLFLACRDTGLLLPLLAAIGMSSLITDYLEVSVFRHSFALVSVYVCAEVWSTQSLLSPEPR